LDTPHKPRILLVDDSPTVLILEEMVLRWRYEVLKATSGPQALRIAADKHPDLILLDIVMPDIDGLETCRLFRTLEPTKTTPIIMVTTRGETEIVESAYLNGATDYVTKPFNQKELLEKIQRYVGVGA
jgi:CheY-like chemotaxis protein